MSEYHHFIDGIHNYCDRWCERCAFTARCRVYATEAANSSEPEANDMRNEAFWKQIQDNFRNTIQMIEKIAQEQGIDLSDTPPAAPRRRRARDPRSKKPLKDSHAYAMKIHDWFEANQAVFDAKSNELVSTTEMELPGRDPEAEAEQIKDAMEIIRWYQFFIHVKLRRALETPDDEANEDEFRLFDSLGSAKVALIAIDRSLAAWKILYEHFSERSDDILNFLVQLNGIRKSVESLLPTARAFQRPGFDEASPTNN
jgi:hypothetical protein